MPDEVMAAQVRAVVERYRKSNRKEQKALSQAQVIALIRKAVDVTKLSDDELDRMVDRLLRPTTTKAMAPSVSPTARDLEREQRKTSLRQRRKYWR